MRSLAPIACLTLVFSVVSVHSRRLPFPTPEADWYTFESGIGEHLVMVKGMGDVNGDGYGDVWVLREPPSTKSEGTAYIYYGSEDGLLDDYAQSFEGKIWDGWFINLDGDQYSDLCMSWYREVDGRYAPTYEQDLRFFRGSSTGLSEISGMRLVNVQQKAPIDFGDLNGDGLSDLIRVTYVAGHTDYRLLVHYGSSSGIEATPQSISPSDHLGYEAIYAGDVNGNGYGDVVLTNRYTDDARVPAPVVALYTGSPSGLSSTPFWRKQYNVPKKDLMRVYFRRGGDLNADGYDDVILAYPESHLAPCIGYGSSSGLTLDYSWDIPWAALVGDYNGDGFVDVAATRHSEGHGADGVNLYHGSTSGPSSTPSQTIESDYFESSLGEYIAYIGDVNGDGGDDFAVVAPGYFCNGMAFVYHGTPGGAVLKRRSRAPSTGQGSISYRSGKILYHGSGGAGVDSRMRVYTTMGKTVAEVEMTGAGKVQEASLDKQGKGAYVVDVSSGNGSIRKTITVVE
ncbi:MAG: hypothetical protein GF344_05715 [Chitinivibrionales bacterium]|nr:hypothetical protein [Chitinivibrionales bacterium]MBD3356464.1 hypothetical protein [Chitinivibrionales bacterium]